MLSGVANTPCDAGSAKEIVGVALANYDDPIIVRCVENVIVVDGWNVSICWRLGTLRIGSSF